MKIRMEPLDQADLPRLAKALGPSEATLSWLSRHPDGPGVAVTAWRGQFPAGGVVVLPSVATVDGQPQTISRLVLGRLDHPDAAPALRDRLRLELGDQPVLALDAHLPETLTTGLGDATPVSTPVWVTGPDPFVPTQPEVAELDGDFDDLAAAVATLEGARLARSAERWRWRYQDHPEHTYRLMHVRVGGRVQGFAAMRIATVSGKRSIVVYEISATSPDVTYLLLKAARRWSWEERSLPVVLVDGGLQKWFALTAGYFVMPGSRGRRRARAFGLPGEWVLHEGDWLRG